MNAVVILKEIFCNVLTIDRDDFEENQKKKKKKRIQFNMFKPMRHSLTCLIRKKLSSDTCNVIVMSGRSLKAPSKLLNLSLPVTSGLCENLMLFCCLI